MNDKPVGVATPDATAPAAPSAGLPMTSKWDPDKIRQEEAALIALDQKPMGDRIRGYFKLTGPAWMQSAMTLGAGSAAASVIAGAFYGYQLLWVQPIAMILGVFMMAALMNITLTKGERGYLVVSRELHPGIAFLWALATIVSTCIWHMGQYALLGGAAWDLANVLGVTNTEGSRTVETVVRFGAGFAILGITIGVTWSYGSKPKGIKLYEGFIKWMVRLVMLAFLIVVVVQLTKGKVDVVGVFKGFFTFQWPVDNPATPINEGATTTILGAIGAAVGINMTFLYPYSILAKGWGKHHKGLARFDLVMSLFVPYVILTSLIIIGMACTIHAPPFGVLESVGKDLTPGALKPVQAAASLKDVLGGSIGRIVFDLGFIGMCCGAISAHMVCTGFTACEMFKLEYTPGRYRLFTLLPAAVGIWGVMIASPIWLPVLASAIAFTMLPIAYIAFFILNNKRSYLGDAVGSGWKRVAFNAVLLVAVGMSIVGSYIKISEGVGRLFKKSPAPTVAPANPPVPVAPPVAPQTPAVPETPTVPNT